MTQTLVEKINYQIDSPYLTQYEKPEWGIIVGDGYGDGMAVEGNVEHVCDTLGLKSLGLIHYGKNKELVEFLLMHPNVREVHQIVPPNHDVFMETANFAGAFYSEVPEKWLPKLLEGSGIDWRSVALTQIKWPWGHREVYWPKRIKLPQEYYDWADEQAARIGKFLIVQPYSLNSVTMDAHWHHWAKAIKWLIEHVDFPLVFPGLEDIPGLTGPRVVNMIRKCPTAMHMLALCERSEGMISTCNMLGLWAVVKKIPGLICANLAIEDPNFFFHRWQNVEPNTIVGYRASFEEWRATAIKWLWNRGVPFYKDKEHSLVINWGLWQGNDEEGNWVTSRGEVRTFNSMGLAAATAKANKIDARPRNMETLSFGNQAEVKPKVSDSETSKHRHFVEEFCKGNGVDIGSSGDPVVPWAIQVELPEDQYHLYNLTRPADTAIQWRGNALELPFQDETLDFVHSSHLLEDFFVWDEPLLEWARVLKPGGHLIIAVPDHERFRAYVQRGRDQGIDCDNLSHKHEAQVGELSALLTAPEWPVKFEPIADGFVSDHPHEYSILFVGKKL